MVWSMFRLKAWAGLEPAAWHWNGYSPSSTREGGLFCGLLVRTLASTALADAHSSYSVSSEDVSHLCGGLDSLTGSSAGRSILNFCLTLVNLSGFCIPFTLVTSSPNCCYHVTLRKIRKSYGLGKVNSYNNNDDCETA